MTLDVFQKFSDDNSNSLILMEDGYSHRLVTHQGNHGDPNPVS